MLLPNKTILAEELEEDVLIFTEHDCKFISVDAVNIGEHGVVAIFEKGVTEDGLEVEEFHFELKEPITVTPKIKF